MFRSTLKSISLIVFSFGICSCGKYGECVSLETGDIDIINSPDASVAGSLLVELRKDHNTPPTQDCEEITFEPLFPGCGDPDAARWYIARFPADIPVSDMASRLAGLDGISRVQYNKILRRPPVKAESAAADDVYPAVRSTGTVFNDPMQPEQWHLINDGNTSFCRTAVEGADVSVKDAWTITGGDPSIIVAVLDEGVMYTHPDLAANIWTNEAELNGIPGADDDGNGYTDDIHGYNFISNTPEISWNKDGDSGHGTHVAGTVAAVNNNGTGVSSVAGGTGNGDGVRLMSCQIFDGKAESTSASLARAFMYAADNGAVIAQCSFGYESGMFESESDFRRQCAAEYTGIQYFLNKENCHSDVLDGNLIIFSAGNEGMPSAGYPGALPSVVTVTSFGPGFQPAGYSNYGTGCNIAAPGGDFYAGRSGYNKMCQVLSTIPGDNYEGSYGWMEGTSMAAPHVTGVAALGLSYAHRSGLQFTREEFISMLLTSVTGIDSFFTGSKPKDATSVMDLSGYVGMMGTGAVDAWKLLMQIEGTPSVQIHLGENEVDMASAIGDPACVMKDYTVSMDAGSMSSLGVTEAPSVKGSRMLINCTRTGSGKITVSANSEGITVTKEISVICRPSVSAGGGWL